MTNGKTNFQKYEEWVNANYAPQMFTNEVTAFIPPLEEGLSVNLFERVMLYSVNGFNITLNGGTGCGKSTLLKNVAVLMDLPYYKDTAYPKMTFERATTNPTLLGDSAIVHPGPLTLAMIHKGIFHLEEGANMDPDNMVQYHETLDKGSVNIPTHFGNIEVNLQNNRDFTFVISGNYDYQKPALNPASTQRSVWVDLPYLTSSQFIELMAKTEKNTEKMKDVKEISDTVASKIKKLKSKEGLNEKNSEVLISMLSKLRDSIQIYSAELDFTKDLNLSVFNRAMRCYSHNMNIRDYNQILTEVVLYPIAARQIYTGRRELLDELKKKTYDLTKSYSALFSEKTESAKGTGFRGLFKN